MKKKTVLNLLIFALIFILTGCLSTDDTISLMDYGNYKNIHEDNIKKIEIIKYTVGGDSSTIVPEDSMINVYNNLKKMQIGKKTNMVCEDNTTVYIFTLTDDTEIKVEIECDWVIIDNNRYILIK